MALEYADQEQHINQTFRDDFDACLYSKRMDLEEKCLQRDSMQSVVDDLSNDGGCRHTEVVYTGVDCRTRGYCLWLLTSACTSLVPHSLMHLLVAATAC